MTGRWRPSVTVAAVLERGGRFLLVEEMIDGRRVLNQPAGHLDRNESLVQAVKREVLEETCFGFEPNGLVGIYRWVYAPAEVTFFRFCFRGRVLDLDSSRERDKQIDAVHWLTPAELTERRAEHRSPLVQRCVEDFLAGRYFPLETLSPDFQ
ncbi:MAG: NUDIX hydrolase [Betaproteobacteria bacterium]